MLMTLAVPKGSNSRVNVAIPHCHCCGQHLCCGQGLPLCMQKYRLYLKRVSGVSPLQGRRGSGVQPEWPPMGAPNMSHGMGMRACAPGVGNMLSVS